MTGVLLAAPGGTGKSTAARRLPPPWQALSDDAALLVPVGERWLAHPWPTWSCFLPGAASSKGGAGGSWAVQQAVPLQAIYFLHRADGEWIEPFGRAQAATRLNESAGQISAGIWKWKPQEQKRALRRACFERSLDLAQSVPCAGLHISLQGAFWEALEADLCAREGAPPACAGLSGCAG
jgi:SynChlorMet cassette protein ScmC